MTVSTLDARAVAGLSHAERTALITRAKSLAVPVASCVAASLRPDHLLADATWDELAALVIVLAEAADRQCLQAIAAAGEDQCAVTGLHELRLRQAHTEVRRLRKDGIAAEDMPQYLVRLEREYQRVSKRRRRAEAAA